MTSRHKKVLVITVVVLALGSLAGVLIYAGVQTNIFHLRHPSDKEMIRDFQEHRQEFVELLQLSQAHEDCPLRHDELWMKNSEREPSSADTEDPVFRRYLDLRKELGVRALDHYGPGGRVVIITSTRGLSISGPGKGYVYSERPSRPLVEDTEKDTVEAMGETYRHIEGRWYLTNHRDT